MPVFSLSHRLKYQVRIITLLVLQFLVHGGGTSSVNYHWGLRDMSGEGHPMVGPRTEFPLHPYRSLALFLLAHSPTIKFTLGKGVQMTKPDRSSPPLAMLRARNQISIRNTLAATMIDAQDTVDSTKSMIALRRQILTAPFALPAVLAHIDAAVARNLPEDTGASGKLRGTTEGLVPILLLSAAVESAAASLPDLEKVSGALASLPATEKDFKRIFDEYSVGISYKQQYLDKNAFVVYYTKGFDGPDRASIEIETSDETKQKAQYGERNDAWVAVDDARSEIVFLMKNRPQGEEDLIELRGALSRAQSAFSNYLSLAPAEQVSAAKGLISR